MVLPVIPEVPQFFIAKLERGIRSEFQGEQFHQQQGSSASAVLLCVPWCGLRKGSRDQMHDRFLACFQDLLKLPSNFNEN